MNTDQEPTDTKPATNFTPRPIDWIFPGYLARGLVTVLRGHSCVGKTTMGLDLAARITTGCPMPGQTERRDPASAIYMCARDPLEQLGCPRFIAAGGDGSRCRMGRMSGGDVRRTLDEITEENAPGLVVVDDFEWLDDTDPRVWWSIQRFSARTGTPVLVIVHPHEHGLPMKNRTGTMPRLVVDIEGAAGGRRIVSVAGCAVGPMPLALTYTIESAPVEDFEAPRIAWGERVALPPRRRRTPPRRPPGGAS